MKFTVFSDPHIGLNRKSHTTQDSRKALKKAVAERALKVASYRGGYVICAGDLFDTYSNDEADILTGLLVADECKLVLAGNHDLSNRSDVTGSLELMNNLKGVNLAYAKVGEIVTCYTANYSLAAIPHHSTQELFDNAIEAFLKENRKVKALFLHCNVANTMAEGMDTSLNISHEQLERLLEQADRIFIGHEHNPYELYDGRVIITGNIHPTSFSDISDKFIWHVSDEGQVTKELVWSMDQHYRKIEWAPEVTIPDLAEVQFVDVVGISDIENRVHLAKFMAEIWKSSDSLFMVRNNVELTSADNVYGKAADFSDLPAEIAKQVEGKAIQPLWEKYSNAALS